ncbi:Pollen receptor-like kinase 4 [Linum perenne]
MGAQVPGLARLISFPSSSLIRNSPSSPLASSCLFTLLLYLATLLSALAVLVSAGSPQTDALLKFKSGVGDNEALGTWTPDTEPCEGGKPNWAGVLCAKGMVWGLQLEHMELTGVVDIDALVSIGDIRTLSLMDNRLDGPLPEVKKLGKLKALFLSNNYFSGEIPADAFDGMGSLKTLYLANNDFTGTIPESITRLPKLNVLKLDGNQFQGRIPEFQQKFLRAVNLAKNDLEGPIPKMLSHMPPNSFSGNKGLCGAPLAPCSIAPPPSPTQSPPSLPPSEELAMEVETTNVTLEVIALLLALVIILIIVLLSMLIIHRRKRASTSSSATPPIIITEAKYMSPMTSATTVVNPFQREEMMKKVVVEQVNQLMFLRDDMERFELQDLLRASAEVLGSGTFGASYKAGVIGQPLMVVKRYRHMINVGREEFHEHMRMIGRLDHPNLLPLVACYYRKEEKLLVSKYMANGSLATRLHGNHTSEQALDWPTRLKIIRGITKGLAHLHNELLITSTPHGHLKSSNVLFSDSFEPMLTDYALRPVINVDHAHKLMIAYKSPEHAHLKQTSGKTDVWSLGIVMLEILTGKYPENYLTQSYNRSSDLATWVNNMVKDKKTVEVFDKDMAGTSKGEMIKVLKLALSCCEEDVERRVGIKEVVDRIERLIDGHDSGNIE